MRTRAYAAPLMRYLQRDDLSNGRVDDPTTLNRYAYVGGNPIQRTDPSGEFWGAHILAGAAIGALVNTAITFVDDVKDGKIDKSWQEYAISAAEGAVSGAILAINPSAGFLGAAALGATAGAAATATGNLLAGKEVTDGLARSAFVGAVAGPLGKIALKYKPAGKVLQKLRIKSIHQKVARYGATPSLQWTTVDLAVKKKIGAESLIERLLQKAAASADDKLNDLVWRDPLKELLGAEPRGKEAIGEN